MKLTIDQIPCDLDPSQRIALDYDAQDLADVRSGNEGHALRLRLPATRANDRIFGFAAEPYTGQRFNGRFAHHTGMHGRAAAHQMHRADEAQPLIRQLKNAQVGQTALHTGAHRGRDGRRLFVDLLQHEVRVAALFSGFLIPIGGQNFPLHRLRELIVEADAVGVHHRHVPLFQHAVPAGIFQQRRDIRRNKVFLFAPAHDERALPLDREQGIRKIPEQNSQRIAAPHHGQGGA